MKRDKILHASVSAFLVLLMSGFMPIVAAAFIAYIIGLLKEIYDKVSGRGCADWRDLVADAVGIAIGALIAWLHC